MHPVTFGVIVFILDLIVDSWIGYRHNLWFSPNTSTPGLLQDFTALAVDFVFNPVLAGLYLWSTEGPTKLFRQLQQSGVFETPNIVQDYVEKSKPIYSSRFVFSFIALTSLLLATSQVAAYQGWVPWKTIGGYLYLDPVAAYYRAPFWLLSFYTMLFGIFNTIVTIFILRRLFTSKGLRIMPLHPDRCGGMVSITEYTIKIAYGIAAAGLVMSGATIMAIQTSTLDKTYPVILGNFLYVVFAPLLFFWPLGTAHSAMKEAKDKQLLELAQRFDKIFERSNTLNENDSEIEDNVKKLENIKKLYAMAEEFPIWPFDMGSLQRFITVVSAPLIPLLVSIAIELFKSQATTP
jgi:hypothetical protein